MTDYLSPHSTTSKQFQIHKPAAFSQDPFPPSDSLSTAPQGPPKTLKIHQVNLPNLSAVINGDEIKIELHGFGIFFEFRSPKEWTT